MEIVKNLVRSEFDEFDEVDGYLIVRQSPMKRVLNLRYDDYESEKSLVKGAYFLSMPYVFFVILYCKTNSGKYCFEDDECGPKLEVAFAKAKNAKEVYLPILGNVSSDFSVCMGGFKISTKTLEELAVKVLDKFWRAEFNSQIDECLSDYGVNKKFIETWQKKTKRFSKWFPTNLIGETDYKDFTKEN